MLIVLKSHKIFDMEKAFNEVKFQRSTF